MSIEDLRRVATDFRQAIERSRADKDTPHLPYFPDGACKLVSRLLALHLSGRGVRRIRFATGHVPGCEPYIRHTWLLVDDVVVDLTADPFGEAPVVVGQPTPFHQSLDACDVVEASADIATFTPDEANRYRRFLVPIEARLSALAALPVPAADAIRDQRVAP